MLLSALAAAAAGCGKKGPPLAPFVRVPAGVETIEARRVGDDVYITFTVPAQNIDASAPADVRRVDVYGYTGTSAPARGQFLQEGTVVASFDVPAAAPPGEAAPDAGPAPLQGTAVTVRETLTPDEAAVPAASSPDGAPAEPSGPLRRFYTALAFSARGVPGPAGAVASLPLAPPPDPPPAPAVGYTADALTVSWDASGGVVGSLFDRALPRDAPPPGIALPPGTAGPPAPNAPVLYNVYRDVAPDPLALPPAFGAAAGSVAPVPVNAMPLAARTYSEPVTLDGRVRCYTVRAVRGAAPEAIEGVPSPPACVTPIDVFPPAAPADLASVASANAISLIWEPGREADLAGYLVLRGEAGGDTLASLTPEPIQEAQFTDETVVPGVRYVYHVIAVDDRLPLPNASAAAIIEETAR